MITFLNGSATGGGAAWGSITGTITDQTDLIAETRTPSADVVFAKGTGPVVVSPDDAKHRLGASNGDNVTTEDVT